MRRSNVLALVVGACLVGALAVAPTEAPAQETDARATRAQAQALFNEGKRLHGAGDYAGALEKFRQGAALEPTQGRWPYNQGLALRKLRRKAEARDAFLRSLAVEPGYRPAEVKRRLKEMGFSAPSDTPPPPTTDTGTDVAPAESAPVDPGPPAPVSPAAEEPRPGAPREQEQDSAVVDGLASAFCCLCPLLGFGGLGYLIYRLTRKKKDGGSPGQGWPQPTEKLSAMSGADLASRATRLAHVSDTLIRVEHALRLGEDDDTRALLNRASLAEQRAYEALSQAREGRTRLKELDGALEEAEHVSREAEARAKAAFGPLAFSGEGERVGCYFCARPLANSDFRVQVPLKRGAGVDTVLACRPCANLVAAGQSPEVMVRQEGGTMLHWSELPDFDPYVHRHRRYLGSGPVPAYDFTPQRSVGELAAMAAGGAVVGGLAVYGISKLLDLDNAREAAAAQAAAQAAAMQASQERAGYSDSGVASSDTWRDRS